MTMWWTCPLLLTLTFISRISSQDLYSSTTTDCDCVAFYLCDVANMTIITNGEGILDMRAGFPKCDNQGDICCQLSSRATTPNPRPLNACGIRNPDGIGPKIINDENVFNLAEFGEFPWMVGIVKSKGSYRCGGSLIHPSVVLTAAHCVQANTSYIARAGEWDSSSTNELLEHQDIKVSSIKVHEDFRPGIYYNDIALLFLESPFTLQAHVNTICLPAANITVSGSCYTSGWGRDRFAKGNYPVILKKIEVPMVSNSQCQEKLRKTRLGAYFRLHNSFVCAGGEEGRDACIGDGGGPLVCRINEDERYRQIGIVSWGIGCGDQDIPGVYTNVPLLREWIDKQMRDNNLAISST